MNDLQDSYQKVEKAYEQKEDEIRKRYTKLEENFKLQQKVFETIYRNMLI